METYVAQNYEKLSEVLMGHYGLSFVAAKVLIRKKNIKVNGKRIGADTEIKKGDIIEIFGLVKKQEQKPEIVFEDNNVLVANKPAGIEVCDGNEETLEKQLKRHYKTIFAVHRIDRNTSGLVIFSKNLSAKVELENMFREHRIQKYYLAMVHGKLKKKQQTMIAYLKKDSTKSLVYISDISKVDYSEIITSYKVLQENQDTSLLEVSIETGKTHQIRAHLAHVGHPIVGDDKYGSKEQNKKLKKHRQMLLAYKIIFKEPKGELEYLRGKVIELDRENLR